MRVGVFVHTILFVMFLNGCGTVVTRDSLNHAAFSASAASIGTAAGARPLTAMGITLCIGLLKETCDHFRGTGFQAGDLLADLAGTIAGGFAAAEICMEDFP